MKNILIFIAGLLLFSVGGYGSDAGEKESKPEQYLTVVCSPDVSPLAKQWAGEFNMLNTGTTVNVEELETGDAAREPIDKKSIGIISCTWLNSMDWEPGEKMIIARDVAVMVMNPGNPSRDEVYTKGITADRLSRMIREEDYRWSSLLGGGQDGQVHLYSIRDDGLDLTMERFLGEGIAIPGGKKLETPAELILAIQNDPYAIGICHLNDIIDQEDYAFLQGVEIMPIDKNANGKLDYFEDIYTNPETFTRSVWVGKYIKELITGVYVVTSRSDMPTEALPYMKWVLTEGQSALPAFGYADLASGEIRSKIDKLTDDQVILEPSRGNYAGFKIILLLLIVSIVGGIIVESIILFKRHAKVRPEEKKEGYGGAFNENTINIPRGLFFDKSHTWAYMNADGKVRIGLDDFLPRVTGRLTGIIMKNPGERIKKGEVVLSLVQKGKQLNIKAPVSGVILEQNKKLQHNTCMVNLDPYSNGWIYMIEPTNWLREIQLLFMADKFRAWLKSEFTRLKDFFATTQKTEELQYAHVVYQEGGELKEGVLMDLGPEVWEEFQLQFMETNA